MPAAPIRLVLRQIRQLVGVLDDADDTGLLAAFTDRRDEAAFAALVGRHGPMVRGVCRRLLGNDHDAADAFQAVFLVLTRKAVALRAYRSLAAWLHEVAVRTALKARTARARRQFHERRAAAMTTRSEPPADVDDLRPLLDEELARLPPKYRLPVVLCDLEGRSHQQAAAEVGCPVGSVSWRLARGRDLLRRRLLRRGVTVTTAALCALLAERSAGPLPAALLQATAGAALAFAAGTPGPAPAAVSLAEEVLKAVPLPGTRVPALVALVLTTLVLGGGLLLRQQAAEPGLPSGPVPAADLRARADLHGDPLPPGALLRLGTLRWRVSRDAHLLEYSPDGKVLAVAERGGLSLWDVATGLPVGRPVKPETYVHALAFAPDGKTMAVVAGDFPGGKGGGRAGEEPPVRLLETATGKELRRFAAGKLGCTALAFSPDGELLAHGDAAGGVALCDPATGEVRGRCDGGRYVSLLAFSRSAAGGTQMLAVASDRDVRLWQVAAGPATASKPAVRLETGEAGGRLALAFTADGKSLVAADRGAGLRVWDTTTGALRHQFATSPDGFTELPALGGDARRVAVIGGLWRDWLGVLDTGTGKEVARVPTAGLRPVLLQFAPDGRTLAALVGEGVVRFWDAGTGKELPGPEGHAGHIRSINLSADGRTVATAAGDLTAALWDATTGRRRLVLPHPYEPYVVALAPDGKAVATGASDGRLRLWDAATGKKLVEVEAEGGCVYALAYSPDGRLLAYGAFHGGALADAATGRVIHRLESDDKAGVLHLAFSADGRRLATAGGHLRHDDGKGFVDVWDVDRTGEIPGRLGKHLCRIEGPSIVRLLSFSADGARLVVDCDNAGGVWDVATGERLRAVALPAAVLLKALSPDGRTLAGATEEGLVLVERATGGRRRTFRGHTAEIVGVRFSRDGRRLLSGSSDTTGLVWDVTGGRSRQADLSAEGLSRRWEALAADDAEKAFDARWDLAAAPQAVAFLRRRLPPVPAPAPGRIAGLVRDLDGETFETRASASAELAKLGGQAESALADLLGGQPTAEARRRGEELLQKLREPDRRGPVGETLRQVRAVEVLETIGTAEAEAWLAVLAKGAPGAALTQEAAESLGRLRRRPRP
jgi:RNA polymerase sigma factor (sigma-70 family)